MSHTSEQGAESLTVCRRVRLKAVGSREVFHDLYPRLITVPALRNWLDEQSS
jgi:hypothetical protein